ncbi:30S ribosome-binding factor RbfA [Candidatus Pantoea edessiphila]|uniref:Ribosome-binding factor A n=1 Tax=Candidatus Pantoea edessiphila TaxID=2044610 RepID=A0A2P5SYA0_9GAMM|nr:30S ribosome-binding factor RbfA [Candidatus Pantoea edessiphila]MBK4775636.1 30S ribosome-binding factor RbfA [Pantoea sp. Edef]PPI87282.1 30S ribosome-binding factor RbfA [Candidatus Pantoea edessiphila]
MIREFKRLLRISHEIKKEITIILQRKINDPRLRMMITVSDVQVSRDLSYAKVFVTFFKETQDSHTINNGMQALKESCKYIRILLKQNMKLRVIPSINFFYDDSFKKGKHICSIINNIQEDSQNSNITIYDDNEETNVS